MGFPYFGFMNHTVVYPDPLAFAKMLLTLAIGQHVKIVLEDVESYKDKDGRHFIPICRTVSTRGHVSTYRSNTPTEYVVDSVDHASWFFGGKSVNCIALRQPHLEKDSHFYDYVLTTEGFLRESELFGLTGQIVKSIEILPTECSHLVPGMRVCFDVEEIPQDDCLYSTPGIRADDDVSCVKAPCLEVDFVKDGLIALREPHFEKENHIYTWFLRSDGVIEGSGSCPEPLYKVKQVCIL